MGPTGRADGDVGRLARGTVAEAGDGAVVGGGGRQARDGDDVGGGGLRLGGLRERRI